MSVWRFQTCEHVEINAPIERVYATASNPEIVPSFAPEIRRIEVVKRLSDHIVLGKAYIRFFGLTMAFLYRYHYRPPTHYSGVQERGRLVRGYFNLTFSSLEDRTMVSHTEGILSFIPCFAWVVGFVYFYVIGRGGMKEELVRLKHLVENGVV